MLEGLVVGLAVGFTVGLLVGLVVGLLVGLVDGLLGDSFFVVNEPEPEEVVGASVVFFDVSFFESSVDPLLVALGLGAVTGVSDFFVNEPLPLDVAGLLLRGATDSSGFFAADPVLLVGAGASVFFVNEPLPFDVFGAVELGLDPAGDCFDACGL